VSAFAYEYSHSQIVFALANRIRTRTFPSDPHSNFGISANRSLVVQCFILSCVQLRRYALLAGRSTTFNIALSPCGCRGFRWVVVASAPPRFVRGTIRGGLPYCPTRDPPATDSQLRDSATVPYQYRRLPYVTISSRKCTITTPYQT
jgi:hypothetical protein